VEILVIIMLIPVALAAGIGLLRMMMNPFFWIAVLVAPMLIAMCRL